MKKYFSFRIILILLFLFRLIVAPIVWHPDLRNHMDWGMRFWEYGPRAFYSQNVWSWTWPNQPPGTMYMFALMRKLFEEVFAGLWSLNISVSAFPSTVVTWAESNLYQGFLKLPAIFSDFGIAYLLYLFIQMLNIKKAKDIGRLGALLFLINPVVWYNSGVWGQYDSVINFLVILSFYLLIKRNLMFSLIAMSLSVYTKASLLIFAPVYLIYALKQKYKFWEYLNSIAMSVILIILFTLPYADKNVFVWLFELYKDKIFGQQLHVITANAFNLWAALSGIHERPDILPFMGLNYKLWSYILFLVFYIPGLYLVFKKPSVKTLIWVLAYVAFATFVLLTNMHERYLYPLFPYFTILVSARLYSFKYYWAISVLSLLNMWHFWWVPNISPLMTFFSFGDRLLPRILGFISFLMFLVFTSKLFRQMVPRKV